MSILRNLVLRLSYFIEEYGITGWFLIGSVHLFVVICAWSIPILLFNPWAPYFSPASPVQAPIQAVTQPIPESVQASLEAVTGQLAIITPTASPQPGVTYGPGTYVVGEGIQPGLYRGQASNDPLEACVWARVRDLTESTDSVIVSDSSQGTFYLEVKATDYALQVFCDITSVDSNLPQVSAFPEQLVPGMYLLGADILPGQYRGLAGDQPCAWARLSGVDGEPNSIIESAEEEGEFVVQMLPSDFAFSTTCLMEQIDG